MKMGERFSQNLKRTVRAALWLPPSPPQILLPLTSRHLATTFPVPPSPFPGPRSPQLSLLGDNWPTHLGRRETERTEPHPLSPFQISPSQQPWEAALLIPTAQMGTFITPGAQRLCPQPGVTRPANSPEMEPFPLEGAGSRATAAGLCKV